MRKFRKFPREELAVRVLVVEDGAVQILVDVSEELKGERVNCWPPRDQHVTIRSFSRDLPKKARRR
jgi:hypothetical protein